MPKKPKRNPRAARFERIATSFKRVLAAERHEILRLWKSPAESPQTSDIVDAVLADRRLSAERIKSLTFDLAAFENGQQQQVTNLQKTIATLKATAEANAVTLRIEQERVRNLTIEQDERADILRIVQADRDQAIEAAAFWRRKFIESF